MDLKSRSNPCPIGLIENGARSELTQHAGDRQFKVKAGDRMPYLLVQGQSIYDKLHQPKFHLLIFSNTASDFPALKTELARWDIELVDLNVIPIDPQAVEIFGTNQSFSVLLRPDNYIASISTDTSLNRVKTYFHLLLHPSENRAKYSLVVP